MPSILISIFLRKSHAAVRMAGPARPGTRRTRQGGRDRRTGQHARRKAHGTRRTAQGARRTGQGGRVSSNDGALELIGSRRPYGDGAGRQARPGTPAIEVSHLTKNFGGRTAVADVSFRVDPGEVFGFLGPNGAGKTTAVRMLGTLIAPTSGSATVAGIPLTPENGVEIRQRISIMPESPGLYLRLSVLENLECFADLYEVPDPRERIDRALLAMGLTGRTHEICG